MSKFYEIYFNAYNASLGKHFVGSVFTGVYSLSKVKRKIDFLNSKDGYVFGDLVGGYFSYRVSSPHDVYPCSLKDIEFHVSSLYREGYSFRFIADHFNRFSIPTLSGVGRWGHQQIIRIYQSFQGRLHKSYSSVDSADSADLCFECGSVLVDHCCVDSACPSYCPVVVSSSESVFEKKCLQDEKEEFESLKVRHNQLLSAYDDLKEIYSDDETKAGLRSELIIADLKRDIVEFQNQNFRLSSENENLKFEHDRLLAANDDHQTSISDLLKEISALKAELRLFYSPNPDIRLTESGLTQGGLTEIGLTESGLTQGSLTQGSLTQGGLTDSCERKIKSKNNHLGWSITFLNKPRCYKAYRKYKGKQIGIHIGRVLDLTLLEKKIALKMQSLDASLPCEGKTIRVNSDELSSVFLL